MCMPSDHCYGALLGDSGDFEDPCLSGGVSWLRTVAPNIHPNVDGEVAYAAPINGLAVGYIQV